MRPPQHSSPSLSKNNRSCRTSNILGVMGCFSISWRLLISFQYTECCISFTHLNFTLWSSSAVTGPNCLCCGCTLRLATKRTTNALTDSNLLREQYLSTEMTQFKPKSGQWEQILLLLQLPIQVVIRVVAGMMATDLVW